MHRKKPFSSKQKKEQLKEKRQRKAHRENDEDGIIAHKSRPEVNITNEKGEKSLKSKLYTVFERESKEEIEKRKLECQNPLIRLPESALILDENNNFYNVNIEGNAYIDMPKRPNWNYKMSKEELEKNEHEYFNKWLEQIYSNYSKERLNYFERNLEVWRQLWRVIEISQIICLITDICYPIFHFPVALYKYITEELKKPLILVLNKIDMVPPEVVDAWKNYFISKFPQLKIVIFSTHPGGITRARKTRYIHRWENSIGTQNLIDSIQTIIKENKIEKQLHTPDIDETKSKYYITIGLLGHPNVGKSSVVNGLVERGATSTSSTPGHTKHLQTIFLKDDICLADCPGLVFPALDMPKQLQVLCGLFPVAQTSEPYSVIKFLAERISIEKIYRLKPPDTDDWLNPNYKWTAYDICESLAIKKGYMTKAKRSDTYRAANWILRDVLSGRIVLAFKPPGFDLNVLEKKVEEQKQEIEIIDQEQSDESSERSDKNDSEDEVATQFNAFNVLGDEGAEDSE